MSAASGNATSSPDASKDGDSSLFQPQRPPEKQRLHASFQQDAAYLAQMLALGRGARNERVDAILELKGSVDASSAKLQAQNATLHRRSQELADKEKRAYNELLSQGKNPHEVTRAAQVKLAADKERRAIEKRIQDKQINILNHLEIEKVIEKRRERLEREKQAFEKKYQAEMGRSALEVRTKAFMVSRTGKEQLDPTGKLVRVYPSQETTIKDHSFGIGRNLVHDGEQRKRIVDKVHAKSFHHDAVVNPMLLPRQGSDSGGSGAGNNNNNNSHPGSAGSARSSSGNNSSVDRDSASPLGLLSATQNGPVLSIPGRELSDVNHKLLFASSSADILPPIRSSSSSTRTSHTTSTTIASGNAAAAATKKGFVKPKLSILEQQMLAKARERQKTNMFQKQVVWGKEFTGDAFLADPSVLWFKDFDVGRPLSLTFTLTNVSNTFNHFKLVDIADEVLRECFEIVYEKPGRMSAGMSCTIRMSFTAVAAVDVDTFLPVVTQTGRFQIPVRCTCKKAVPVLLQREIQFKDVVAGEKKVVAVTLENQGALSLHFSVKRIEGALESSSSGPEVDDLNEELDASILQASLGGDEHGEDMNGSETSGALKSEGESGASVMAVENSTGASAGNPNEASGAVAAESGGEFDTVDSSGEALTGENQLPAVGIVDHPTWSAAEESILEFAKAVTVYKPEGSETSLRHTKYGVVAPYSSTVVTFTFTPATPMTIANQVFTIEFAQEGANSKTTKLAPSSISVSAEANQVPIFTAEQTLNLGCCVYEKLYRHQLVVYNRGKVTLKIQVRVPKVLESFVEFTPNMGYVQAAAASTSLHSSSSSSSLIATDPSGNSNNVGKFVIQVKFRPQPGMWRRLQRKGFGNEALGFIAVPVQVIVPDQVVPVFFLLVARLTSSGLIFSTDSVDFGNCPLGHSVSHTMTIESTARLPQHFGFLRLPQHVKIDDPSDGVGGTLLPFEKKTLKLVYQPSTATPMRSKLCVRTSLNQEYFLSCTGSCLATPLVFSHNFVRLGATQLDQSQTFSILCSNISEKVQCLELLPPEGSQKFLRLTPLVNRIAPNSSARIEIVFSPTKEIFEVTEASFPSIRSSGGSSPPPLTSSLTSSEENEDLDEKTQDLTKAAIHGESAASVTVNRSNTSPAPALIHDASLLRKTRNSTEALWQIGIPQEERSVHHGWTVLCFRRSETSIENSHGNTASGPLLSIQVATTTIDPKVFSSPSKLNYSQVAIGQSLVMELTLTNSTNSDMVLSAKALHALGGFRMINSLRPIKRNGGTHVVKMEFKPTSPIIYEDELELNSASIGNVKISLRGEGINPSLSYQPADGWLDFKDVLARNKAVHDLVLTNASSFPLTYSIVLYPEGSSIPVMATNGLPVFTFTPSEAVISAHGSLVIKVAFNAVLQRPEHYKQRFRIKVPSESERYLLTLSGRCWEDQLYVFAPALLDLTPSAPDRSEKPALLAAAPSPPPVIEDPFDLPPTVNLSLLSAGTATTLDPLLSAGLRKTQQTLTLTFNESNDGSNNTSDGYPMTQQLIIGSTLSPLDDETRVSAGATAGKPGSASSSSSLGSAAGAVAGSFELVLVENATHPEYTKLFALEPMKGTLAAGQQVPVHVTYSSPPAQVSSSSTTARDDDSADTALRDKQKELAVSQWIEVQALCTLRGGFLWRQLPPSGGGGGGGSGQPQPPVTAQKSGSNSANDLDARTVLLTLRAKMQT